MNKQTNLRAMMAALAIAVFTVIGFSQANAQSAQTAKVVVVDLEEIQRSSLAGKDLFRQMENQRAELEAEQARLRQEAENARGELERQSAILTEDALQEKARTLQQQLGTAENEYRDRVRRYQIATNRASQELQSVLTPIYQELMNKHSANMILERGTLILAGPGMDITREVIEKLDASMPTLKLDIPAAGSSVN